ncbi:adhesion G protein-coupled receptor L1-like isoform X1 [Lates japonicus]|uniref:Adhesion G protein-coupled receptor L1-like isoform X1 n=1 Tax=Lates japonicus TaxID=270547 RepID=A0AAD3MTI3_LATJO|nr:adhesion G protein-coupled receptor L1-like isoform X1 [Lates japonicus]
MEVCEAGVGTGRAFITQKKILGLWWREIPTPLPEDQARHIASSQTLPSKYLSSTRHQPPPNNLYSDTPPRLYSEAAPSRFYTSPPTLSYPDSSPEGPEEVSPTGPPQRPALELPYSLGRPPLGPRPNHLQTFYQPPPLASNGEAVYTAEPTSEGDDGQMQRVTSL